MRKFVFAFLFPFLTGCTTDVSARSGQDHVAYVQLGDNWLKVDLGGQRFEALLGSPKSTAKTGIHVVNRDDGGINMMSLVSAQECRHLDMQWKSLPVRFASIGSAITDSDAFVIAHGVLIDTKRGLYLDGVCPGVITSAVTYGNVLLFSRKEVSGEFIKKDRVLGFEFSDREIVARSDANGAPPSNISKFKGKVRALSIDPLTGDALIVREVSRVSAGGWLRALAGHPKQTSEYDLIVIDKSVRSQRIINLGPGRSGQVVNILF